jgi:hypothetical protein
VVENERGGIGGGALDQVIVGITSGARGAAGDWTPIVLPLTGGDAGEATRGGVGATAVTGFAGPGLGSPGLPGSRIVLG